MNNKDRVVQSRFFEEQLFEAKHALFAESKVKRIKFLQNRIKYLQGKVNELNKR